MRSKRSMVRFFTLAPMGHLKRLTTTSKATLAEPKSAKMRTICSAVTANTKFDKVVYGDDLNQSYERPVAGSVSNIGVEALLVIDMSLMLPHG